ncbi:hypothetical protein [Paraburkholderia kururiensis]|jgi:hypothetical protein|uniref:hypothetical protein n=1 Tax=Paraburkholderia kururiensis TaxID=984307 RepID=UPI000F867E0C|nr:hypothetical protein [Paraburkholderia kururiensis]
MGMLSWMWHRNTAVPPAASDEVRDAVERIVKLHPQLRLVGQYEAHLGRAVSVSLQYVEGLVESLPPAREASAAAWSSDACIHAFFTAPDDVAPALSRSTDLQHFFDECPAAGEVFAVLGMAMTERRAPGAKQVGLEVRSDVMRTTVSFGDYQVRVCGLTETLLRREIVRRVLDQLALEGLSHVEADTARRDALQQERALLKARMQLLERGGVGMRQVMGSGTAPDLAERAKIQSLMDENERSLADLGLQTDALQRELQLICDVLADPASHLDVTRKRLRLNAMNVVLEDNDPAKGEEIEFRLARLPADPGTWRAFALVRFSRADLLPPASMHEEARHLVI